MKKKILASFLSLCMMVSLIPTTVFAEGVNVINTVDDLKAAAVAGGEYTLGDNITVSSTIAFEKAIKIVGDGEKTITATVQKPMQFYDDVTLEKIVIVNTADGGRCVDTRSNVKANIIGCNLTATGGGNPQPITIGGYDNGVVVNIENTTVNAGTSGYGIINFVKGTVTVKNSEISGYGALHHKVDAAGAEYEFINSKLSSENTSDGNSNAFATISFDSAAKFTAQGGSFKATATGAATQGIFGVDKDTTDITVEIVLEDTVLETSGEKACVTDKEFNLTPNAKITASGKSEAAFEAVADGKYYYTTLSAAVAAADAGAEITMLNDTRFDSVIDVNKKLTLNLNGKTISLLAADSGDGIFRVLSGGDLTINGNGTLEVVEHSKEDGIGYAMAIWADGGKVTINGGKYTSENIVKDWEQYDLIYVKNGGEIIINDGTFVCKTPRWTLNSHNEKVGTIVVNGGKFYQFDPAKTDVDDDRVTLADGFVSVKDGDYYVVKAIENLKHEVKVEVPTIDESVTTTQTTVSQEAQKEIADIGNNLVEAIKEAAKESDDAKIVEVIEEAVADLNLEGEHHDDVVEALVEAVKNNDEITITIAVDSTPVPDQVAETSTEVAEMKEAIEEAGLVIDENSVVLDITVTKTISTSSAGVVEEKELSEIAAPITHTIVFPEVPAVVEGMQRVWTMYSYHDGIVEKYPVTDNGDGTGTFASSKYSYYLLAYEVVPVEQAAEHNWSDDFKMNDEYHWRYCEDCGVKKTRHAHVDANKDGICDACNYKVTTTGRENPVTGVTADMLK